ncbi:hypothetical protein Hanom_Chr06g00576381 [Helianthus anomalus]
MSFLDFYYAFFEMLNQILIIDRTEVNVDQIYRSTARFLIGCCYEIVIKCNLHLDFGEFDVISRSSSLLIHLFICLIYI